MVLKETDQKIMSFEQLVLRIPGGKDGVRGSRASFHEPTIWPRLINDLLPVKLSHTTAEK
jgi:hypothetical protein